ncbi:ATP-dependent DNA helicase chl1 [Coemansia sp. RSA 1933]|nr:ATP-dependent DNA helicase chl1 [Coemansia sp. RSA 1933]
MTAESTDAKLDECQDTTTAMLSTPQTAAEYSFPMTPYDIQLDFMKRLFQTIEHSQFAIFESPTGTGKSLSIICGALTWLLHNAKRPAAADKVSTTIGEPDWVVAYEQKRREAEENELDDGGAKAEARYRRWVANTRRAEAKARSRFGGTLGGKTASRRTTSTGQLAGAVKRSADAMADDDGDSDGLVVDAYYSDAEIEAKISDEPVQYSRSVRKLLQRRATDRPLCDSSDDDSDDDDNEDSEKNGAPKEPQTTKILYASRTHSQLQQFVHEVKRTAFATRDRIRCVTLGSRKQLCTNERVRQASSTVYALNERCTEMQQQSGSKTKRCPFLPLQQTPMLDFKDAAAGHVMDIEELAAEGRRLGVCAYYGTRASVNAAHVVALPYNMLLSRTARDAMGVSLRGNVVIIDEAHNLVDTVLAIHSVSLDRRTVNALQEMLQAYLARYWRRLGGSNAVHIRQAMALLRALSKFMARCNSGVTVMPVNEFLQSAHADHINVYKIDRYLRMSKLGRKLNMFAEKRNNSISTEEPASKRAMAAGNKQEGAPPSLNPATAVAAFEAFMECMGNPKRGGARMVVNASGSGDSKDVELKYLLLDPSEAFGEICREARAVILAGGTMKPTEAAVEQLLPRTSNNSNSDNSCCSDFPCSRLDPANARVYGWNHVVAASHICALAIGCGPTGVPLRFALQDQKDPARLREAGNALAALCGVIPGGVVVFFPSYALLRAARAQWESSGIVARISKRKPVFSEATGQPLQGEEDALSRYTRQVDAPGSRGAVLLSVVGGKLSEGINFSDDLGRAVVMVGVPYPSLGSPELVERLAYYESGGGGSAVGSGGPFAMGPRARELYESMCMRAVNQSIGRAIRHRGDYAAIVFLDCRYAEPRIAGKLPAWIAGGEGVESKAFGPALAAIASFFKRDFSES